MTNSQPPTPDQTDSWDGAECSDEAEPTRDADRSASANLPEGADESGASEGVAGTGTTSIDDSPEAADPADGAGGSDESQAAEVADQTASADLPDGADGPEAADASEGADGTGTTDDTDNDGSLEAADPADGSDGGGDEDYLPPGQTAVPVGDEVVVDDDTMRRALEAILMVTDEPLPVLTLARAVGRPTGDVAGALAELAAEYTEQGRGFDLREVGGGWRYYTRVEAAPYVERFVLDGQQARLTQAALETLSVVAYKQPVSRARVSAIRGVNVDGVMRTLVARGLVEEAGSDTESQATLYRTTSYFLERMGMQSLDDLPELAPYLPDMDDIEDELAAQSLPPAEPTPETPTAEGADAEGANAEGADAEGADADGADAEDADADGVDAEARDGEGADAEAPDAELPDAEGADVEAPDGDVAGADSADAEALDVEDADAEGVEGVRTDDELDAEASGSVDAVGVGELDAEDRGDDGDAVAAPAQADSGESAEASDGAPDDAEMSGWDVESGAEGGDDVVSDRATAGPAGERAGGADGSGVEGGVRDGG
ncbi:SMC-Scp complex subunit ScpB [Kribbella sp. NPDC003505]|uniref:SMC-Scp complex subunit ScpB n=1 Tax=Kribbella sp. NPDC003505 TaxID=3154448 RepID=UPI0033ABFECE